MGKLPPSRDKPRLDEVVLDELAEGCLEGSELAAFLPLGVPSELSRGESSPGRDAPQSLFSAELSCNRIGDEAAYLVSLILRQVVDLVEHEERGLPALREHAEQLTFLSRQGRVGREDEDRSVCIEQCPACFLIVVPVDGAETRRVDEDHAGFEESGRHLQLDAGHLPRVLRVALLGDELRDLVWRDLVTRAIEGYHNRSAFSEGDLGGDGGERQHASGKNVVGKERVDERRFAALELAEHRDVEASLCQAIAEALSAFGDVACPVRGGRQLEGRCCQLVKFARHGIFPGSCPITSPWEASDQLAGPRRRVP